MLPFFTTHFGNPGSGHVYGDEPQKAVHAARIQILSSLFGIADPNPESLIFTSCGTESDNLGIHLVLAREAQAASNNAHVVTSDSEHPAVLECLKYYETRGVCTVTYIKSQRDGRVRAVDVNNALQPNTVLVAIMLANNESGALNPISEITKFCRPRQIPVLVDAAQAAGKVCLKNIADADFVTIVGHKMGAPKGIAALYVREPGKFKTGLLLGGGQEFGLRAGTENVGFIRGFAKAAEMAACHDFQRMEIHRHRLKTRLEDGLGKLEIHGPENPADRLPNTLSVGFGAGLESAQILAAVRTKVAASAGATCHGGSVSSVLLNMGIPEAVARSTVRLSLGPDTTSQEIDEAAEILIAEVKSQRRLLPDKFGSNL